MPASSRLTATVVASTHVAGVPDTTVGSTATGFYEDASGHMTTDPSQSAFGPVWAIDDATDTYKVHSLGDGNYAVDRMVNGTFQAFAQPNTGLSTVLPLNVSGQLHGTISYVVHSANGPDASALLPEQAIGTGSHAQLKQLFPGIAESDISGGSDWVLRVPRRSRLHDPAVRHRPEHLGQHHRLTTGRTTAKPGGLRRPASSCPGQDPGGPEVFRCDSGQQAPGPCCCPA